MTSVREASPAGAGMTAEVRIDSGRRWAIMGAVMLGMFLSAMDQTIVGTAMPRIIAELSGLELYAWVFTSYMLTSTTFMPIVGRAGDLYGRKPLFLIGISVFLAGSVLSGMSQSMVQLIVFRGLQGIGGGFIFANAFAIIGDLFTPAERGRYAGMMSGVFGLASVIGPLIGGAITDHLSWRWVFYVNIPLGLAALAVLALVLPAGRRSASATRLDYLGAFLLAAAIAPLLLAFSWAGTEYAWASPQVLASFAASAVMFALFLMVEMRAEDPVVPLSIFRNRIFTVCMAVSFVSGAGMFAGMVYIPLFMQGVLDFSATNAGLVLTPMTLGMVSGSVMSGQLVARLGHYKWMTTSGLVVAPSGMWMLSQLDAGSAQWNGMLGMSILGFGLGMTIPMLVLAAQNALPHSLMGVSTSLVTFVRSVGATIGVAIMGSLLTRRLDDELAAGLPAQVQERAPEQLLDALANPRLLLDDGALRQVRERGFDALFGADAGPLFEATLDSMRDGLAESIGDVFLLSVGVLVVALAISLFLREIPLRTTMEAVEEEPERAESAVASPAAPVGAAMSAAPPEAVARLSERGPG